MICPNCNVYAVHPDSLKGWCKKCTGVLTGQVLKPMCMACGLKYADERSEHGFCYKCHFDMTDELLDQTNYEANMDELDKQIEIATRELVETTLNFCNMVSGAINCYEDGTIKDLMKDLSTKARDTATRVMAYTDVRDSHRK